jgi:hypothetical protein
MIFADDAYPTNTMLSPLYFKQGEKVIIAVITVDDWLEIKLGTGPGAETIGQSDVFYDGWKTFDITHNLQHGKNTLSFISTDYGPGGENYWSLKASCSVKCFAHPAGVGARRK